MKKRKLVTLVNMYYPPIEFRNIIFYVPKILGLCFCVWLGLLTPHEVVIIGEDIVQCLGFSLNASLFES